MLTRSRKAKGRRLQNYVRDRLAVVFGLDQSDIKTAVMGESGADVRALSDKAKRLIPFSIECKNDEGYGKLYKAWEQACGHGKKPLLIIKSNHKPVLAVIDFDELLEILNDR